MPGARRADWASFSPPRTRVAVPPAHGGCSDGSAGPRERGHQHTGWWACLSSLHQRPCVQSCLGLGSTSACQTFLCSHWNHVLVTSSPSTSRMWKQTERRADIFPRKGRNQESAYPLCSRPTARAPAGRPSSRYILAPVLSHGHVGSHIS